VTTAPLVDVNTATADALRGLPGIGPKTAQKIIAARPFATVDDLTRVKGIGPKKLGGLKHLVRAGTSPPPRLVRPKVAGRAMRVAPKVRAMRGVPSARSLSVGQLRRARVAKARPAPEEDGLIDINTATAEALDGLPGIGPKTAEKIIAARPFATVDELTRVKGIGPKKLERMRPLVVVREPEPDSDESGGDVRRDPGH
jgi:competence protein ComEA